MPGWSTAVITVVVLTTACASICDAQLRMGPTIIHDSTVSISAEAGSTLSFDILILDENLDTVGNWSQIGQDVLLSVRGSTAELDTGTHSWNNDPEGFSWMKLAVNSVDLSADSVSVIGGVPVTYFTIPVTAFNNGYASLTFKQSKAGEAIVLSVEPSYDFLTSESPPVTIVPAVHAGYLVDLTSATPDSAAVFLLRRYEVVVVARDRYLNPLIDQAIRTAFSARFPGEFTVNRPEILKIFRYDTMLLGWTIFFLDARIPRGPGQFQEERQEIYAFSAANPGIRGESRKYSVLDHAPFEPTGLSTPDSSTIVLTDSTALVQFTWQMPDPPDAYTNILISRFDSTNVGSDTVRYTIVVTDPFVVRPIVRVESDDNGLTPAWTITQGEFARLVDSTGTLAGIRQMEVRWFVTATDGLYTTFSFENDPNQTHPTGFLLTVQKDFATTSIGNLPTVAAFSLGRNYPNPFRPETSIPVEMNAGMSIRLRVFNLLGEEVALLHNGFLPAGEHIFRFDGAGLPSGAYSYRVESEHGVLTRNMMLMR